MLRLPVAIEVQLVDGTGNALSIEDVLVGINVLYRGRYYYGNLIGLTDAAGRASVGSAELQERFRADRVAFPMDYKIDLEECDPEVELFILSREQLTEARTAVTESDLVPPEIKEAYARARNAMLVGALVRVDVSVGDERPLAVPIPSGVRTK